jgi:hypothetical protein
MSKHGTDRAAARRTVQTVALAILFSLSGAVASSGAEGRQAVPSSDAVADVAAGRLRQAFLTLDTVAQGFVPRLDAQAAVYNAQARSRLEDDLAAAQAQLKGQQDAHAAIVAEIARLEAVLKASAGLAGVDLEELKKQLEAAKATLAEKEATKRKRANGNDSGIRRFRALAGEPLVFFLVGDQVVPADGEHFEVSEYYVMVGNGQFRVKRTAKRTKEGVPLGQALAKGGVLDEAMQKAGSEKDKWYLKLLVNIDAVPTFRKVAAEAHVRGVALTWTSYVDSEPLSLGGGGTDGPDGI